MNVYPDLDIRFPEDREAELLDGLQQLVKPPWSWQNHDAFGRAPDSDRFYLHRDEWADDPPCTICLHRRSPGHLVAVNIVPDWNMSRGLSVEQYARILRDFDVSIAGPVAEHLGGITMAGTTKHTLEDYFSLGSVKLLQRFCDQANQADLGTNLGDQERWMRFLIAVHKNNERVHCDTFGACLREKGWWPESGIHYLVHEFDFAMRLLGQAASESIE